MGGELVGVGGTAVGGKVASGVAVAVGGAVSVAVGVAAWVGSPVAPGVAVMVGVAVLVGAAVAGLVPVGVLGGGVAVGTADPVTVAAGVAVAGADCKMMIWLANSSSIGGTAVYQQQRPHSAPAATCVCAVTCTAQPRWPSCCLFGIQAAFKGNSSRVPACAATTLFPNPFLILLRL
ncbi:MAG: hypothetical protein R3D55_26275 [Chloroflexota bacterium]